MQKWIDIIDVLIKQPQMAKVYKGTHFLLHKSIWDIQISKSYHIYTVYMPLICQIQQFHLLLRCAGSARQWLGFQTWFQAYNTGIMQAFGSKNVNPPTPAVDFCNACLVLIT